MIEKLTDLTVETLCLQILLFVQDDRTKGIWMSGQKATGCQDSRTVGTAFSGNQGNLLVVVMTFHVNDQHGYFLIVNIIDDAVMSRNAARIGDILTAH